MSYISALLIAGLVVGWMYSDDLMGTFAQGDKEQEEAIVPKVQKDTNMSPDLIVQALKVVNQQVPLQIRARGVTRTGFKIDVISRRKAFVLAQIAVEDGWVKAGATLV